MVHHDLCHHAILAPCIYILLFILISRLPLLSIIGSALFLQVKILPYL